VLNLFGGRDGNNFDDHHRPGEGAGLFGVIKVEDVAPNGYAIDRATVRQKKTRRPVRFELTDQTRQAVDDYLKAAHKKPGEFLSPAGAAWARA